MFMRLTFVVEKPSIRLQGLSQWSALPLYYGRIRVVDLEESPFQKFILTDYSIILPEVSDV